MELLFTFGGLIAIAIVLYLLRLSGESVFRGA